MIGAGYLKVIWTQVSNFLAEIPHPINGVHSSDRYVFRDLKLALAGPSTATCPSWSTALLALTAFLCALSIIEFESCEPAAVGGRAFFPPSDLTQCCCGVIFGGSININ